jgi:NH3-dependent NAD+ synthetase
MNELDPRLQAIIDWIRRNTDIAAGRGALVPVSGGSDSALGFWLCAQALPPGRTIGAFVGTELRCRGWFEQVGPVRLLPEPQVSNHIEAARWALMLSLSLEMRGWLVGTHNRTEQVFGTFSLASRVATLLPLAGLWKSEVMELAASVGVPEEILDSSRRADPACGRPQAMADIPFATIDRFLQVRSGERAASELESIAPTTLEYLDTVYRRNRFKLALPLTGPGAARGGIV